MHRRRDREQDARSGNDRFSAEAVPSLPTRCPSPTSCGRSRATEQEILRLLLLVPEAHALLDGLGPDQLPSTVARELFRAVVLARAHDDQGIHPPFR